VLRDYRHRLTDQVIATGCERRTEYWGPMAYPLQAMCHRGQTEAVRWFENEFGVVTRYAIEHELVKWAVCRGHLDLAEWLLRFDRRGLRHSADWEFHLAPRDELRARRWLQQRNGNLLGSSV